MIPDLPSLLTARPVSQYWNEIEEILLCMVISNPFKGEFLFVTLFTHSMLMPKENISVRPPMLLAAAKDLVQSSCAFPLLVPLVLGQRCWKTAGLREALCL